MGQQLLRRPQKPHRMRQLSVEFKSSLIHPLGMDREPEWLPERFEYTESHPTCLGSRRLNDLQQLGAKLRLLSGHRLKLYEEVNRHMTPPAPILIAVVCRRVQASRAVVLTTRHELALSAQAAGTALDA